MKILGHSPRASGRPDSTLSRTVTAFGLTAALILGFIAPIAADLDSRAVAIDSAPPAVPTTIVLSSSSSTFAAGQPVTLTATADVDIAESSSTVSIIDTSTGLTLKTCSTGNTCVLTSVPFNTGPTRSYEARLGSLVSNEIALTREAWTVNLVADRTTFRSGEPVTLTATANQNVANSSSSYRLRIYDVTAGTTVKYCNSGFLCAFTAVPFTAGAPHTYTADVAAYVSDSGPGRFPAFGSQVDIQANSNDVTLSRAAWTVALSSDKTTFAAGEAVTLTASVNQSLSAYSLRIYDLTTQRAIAYCDSGVTCSHTSLSLFNEGEPHEFVADVASLGDQRWPVYGAQTDVQATSNQVVIARKAWSVTLSVDKGTFAAGDAVTLTAVANQNLASTAGAYKLRIYDLATGQAIKFCASGTTCSVSTSFSDGPARNYKAEIAASINGQSSGNYPQYGTAPDVQASSNLVSAERQAWTVTLTTDKTSFATFEDVALTATANQRPDKTGGKYRIRIYDLFTGATIKFCDGAQVCVANGNFMSGGPRAFVADVSSRIADNPAGRYIPYGSQVDLQALSNEVSVARKAWTVELEISEETSSSGLRLVLSATANQRLSWSGYKLQILNFTTGHVVKECEGYFSCVASIPRSSSDPPRMYLALITDTNGGDVQAMSNGYSFDPGTGAILQNESIGGSNPSEKLCQCFHADPINSSSGEFYLPVNDIALPGAGPALSIVRTYSTANAGVNGPFGYGWSSALTTRLRTLIAGVGTGALPRQVEIVQENGSTVVFTGSPNGTFIPPSRVLAELTYDSDLQRWKFTRQSKEILVFDQSGRLLSLSDQHGNAVSLTRNTAQKVVGLSASGGRALDVTWSGDYITKVADSAGREVEYVYSPSGNLTSSVAVDGSVTSYGYNAGHFMTSIVSPGGGTTQNVYDSSNRVTTQTDPLNRVTAFSYSGSTTTITHPGGAVTKDVYSLGRLISQTEAFGTPVAATNTFVYDTASNITSATDPLGNTTTYTYDTRGNRLSETNALGKTTTFTYDANNGITSVTDPLNRVATATYTTTGSLASVTSPSGATSTRTYNPNGTLASSTDARGGVTTYAYDTRGLQTSTTDPNGGITSLAYRADGVVISASDPAGGVTTITSDAAGRMLSTSNPLEEITEFDYDLDGNLTSITDPLGNAQSTVFNAAGEIVASTDALGAATIFAYNPAGDLVLVVDALNQSTAVSRDVLGRAVGVTDPIGRTTAISYDKLDRVLAVTRPSGAVSSASYDALGRVVTTTDALGNMASLTYDAVGQLKQVTDPLGRATQRVYSADGRVTSVVYADLSTESYIYDAAGSVTSFTNADGKVTSYSYDIGGRLSEKIEPGGMQSSYGYDLAGRVGAFTRPDSSVVEYGYDLAGRLSTVDYLGSSDSDVAFSYDEIGQRVAMVDATGTSTYNYDAAGRTISAVNGDGAELEYEYDALGRLEEIVYPGARGVHYDYDAAGQLSSVEDWANRETTMAWTADGQLATQSSPNGVTQTHTYDLGGQTTSILTASTAPISELTFDYDNAGQLVSDERTGSAPSSHQYSYDLISQLTGVDDGAVPRVYSSTPAGLLLESANASMLAYNAAQQLTSIEPTSGPATTFSYDANGSRVSSTTAAINTAPAEETSFSYTSSGSLHQVILPDASQIAYAVDGDGLRQSRTESGDRADYLWSTVGDLPLLLSDGSHSFIYGAGATPIAQVDEATGSIEYLHADLLGTPRTITSSSGSVVGSIEYDEFGSLESATGSASTAIGFTGNLTDPETGMVYLRARDYDPTTRQFLTVDPAVDSTNQPYAYVANNPITNVDPSGLSAEEVGFNAASFFIGMQVGALDALTFGMGSELLNTWVPGFKCITEENPFYGAGNVSGQVAIGIATLPLAGAGVGALATVFFKVAKAGVQSSKSLIASAAKKLAAALKTASVRGIQPSPAQTAMAAVRAKGSRGEAAAGIVKNTVRIPAASGQVSYRVPDAMNAFRLDEVKNVAELRWTSQLSDFYTYAQATNRIFVLHVRSSTKFVGYLEDLRASGGVIRIDVPGMHP